MRALALPLVLLAFHGSIQPLPPPLRNQIAAHRWHQGCPVPLSRLRVLTVSYWGFDGRTYTGRLVVNQTAAAPLLAVFRRLYGLHFAIRRMQPVLNSGDVTSSFDCRAAAPSPCPGTKATGHWSMHAYGLAVDVNPIENPYAGCGRSVPLDRLGLGRLLDRHEGLHALLVQRPLDNRRMRRLAVSALLALVLAPAASAQPLLGVLGNATLPDPARRAGGLDQCRAAAAADASFAGRRPAGEPGAAAEGDLEPAGLRGAGAPGEPAGALLPRGRFCRRGRQRHLRRAADQVGGAGGVLPPLRMEAVRDPRVGPVGPRRPAVHPGHGPVRADAPAPGVAGVRERQTGELFDLASRPRSRAVYRSLITPL